MDFSGASCIRFFSYLLFFRDDGRSYQISLWVNILQVKKIAMQITILFRVVAVAVFLHTFTASEILVTGILNRQSGSCAQDDDCSSRETFLYCINRQCQCLQGGSSYVHGVLLQFNMEWDPYQTKCVSKPGSPCTFKVK